MPVTVTAKRALRSSARKAIVNKLIISKLEMSLREAKKLKSEKAVRHALSMTDRAAKKNIIHKNKASRIKSALSKLAKPTVKPKIKKASKKK
jgi:small subunit ribosomal protein S20